jgi:superfamily II DNA helicase RecQ
MLREKLESLLAVTATAQQQVNDHLIALLAPARMVVLWKLKGGLAQLEKMLKTTLQRPSLAVSEALLDMVQSTESVLNEVDQRLRLFDEEDLA